MTVDVLFAHAYFVRQDRRPLGFMHPLPPGQPAELAAWIAQETGLRTELWDATFRVETASFEVEASRRRPRVVWIFTHPATRTSALELLDIARRCGAVALAGGPDATLEPARYLEHADAVLPGECDDALLQLVQALRGQAWRLNDAVLDRVPGLLRRGPDGPLPSAGKPRLIDLDRLPPPCRDPEATRIHLERWRDLRRFRPLGVRTARGCPRPSGFDSGTVFGRPYRRRSPASVVDEIADLVDRFDVDRIVFTDEVFLFDDGWLRELAALLLARGLQVPFEGRAHPRAVGKETLRRLVAAGLVRLDIEAASGSAALLERLDWPWRPADVYQAAAAAREAGVTVGLAVLVGLPGETRGDLDATLELVRVVQPSGVDVVRVEPAAPAMFQKDWERVVAGPFARKDGPGLPAAVEQAAVAWLLSVGMPLEPDLPAQALALVSRVRRPLLRAAVRLLPG